MPAKTKMNSRQTDVAAMMTRRMPVTGLIAIVSLVTMPVAGLVTALAVIWI